MSNLKRLLFSSLKPFYDMFKLLDPNHNDILNNGQMQSTVLKYARDQRGGTYEKRFAQQL